MIRIPYYYLLAALFVTGLAVSCTKGDDTLPDTPLTTPLNVINTTGTTVNFYVNGTRQNTAGGIVSGGSTGYFGVPVGNQLYAVETPFNRVDLVDADTLFTLPVKLDTSRYVHSLFITGNSRSSALITTDSLSANIPAANNASVRFVHAAGSIPPLRVAINDTVRYDNAGYKSVSAFKPVSKGVKTVKVYAANGTTPLLSVSQTFASGRIYTLFVQGSLNQLGDNAFRLILIAN